MGLIRILIIGLLIYWFFRLLGLIGSKKQPRVRRPRSKPEVDRFKEADIEEVTYTELPPEKTSPDDASKSAAGANNSDDLKQ
jgi:hypothetical protein